MTKTTSGFTIVELLIVIVVIAILAAVSIIAYIGIQDRARDSAIQSDIRNLSQKLEVWRIDEGHYPFNYNSALQELGFSASKNAYATAPTTIYNLTYCWDSVSRQNYSVVALSTSGNIFYVTNETGGVRSWDGEWIQPGLDMCASLGPYDTNFHGYRSSDTTSGPWRAWVGGN